MSLHRYFRPLLLIITLFLSFTEVIADRLPTTFNPESDLFLAQFDSKTDVDDLHSVVGVATMLGDPSLSVVTFHAVAGAYGIQEGLYVPAPDLFDLAFGENWSNAHLQRDEALKTVVHLVTQTLSNGGDVWVAEAGQSDFTADWLRQINEPGLSFDSKARVHIVQHSEWNESVTSPDKLEYVRQFADYQKIPDGNVVGNGSPGLRTYSDVLWKPVLASDEVGDLWRLARQIADKYNGKDGRYNNEAIEAGGMDFSDVAESCWILGYAGLTDAETFFTEFIDSK